MIELIVISSLWCCGLHLVTRNGHALDFISRWLDKIFYIAETKGTTTKIYKERWFYPIYKPILDCVVCMASLHSIFIYAGFCQFSFRSFYELPVMMAGVAFLNALLYIGYERHIE